MQHSPVSKADTPHDVTSALDVDEVCTQSVPERAALEPSLLRRLSRLFAVIVLTAVCFGYILPKLASRPTLQAKMERLEELGIDPNAFFYSDHPYVFER